MTNRVHFLYEAGKEPNDSFAHELITTFGQCDFSAAETVVSVGGDGLLLQALRHGAGKKIFGMIAPTSDSVGFWTNKNINDAAQLQSAMDSAGLYMVKPIQADICFADGSKTTRYGYNEISIQLIPHKPTAELVEKFNLNAIDLTLQSTLLNLSVHFANSALGPKKIMGRGFTFSSAFGSTAMNRANGASAVDIRRESIILSAMGAPHIQSIVNDSETIFNLDVGSLHKRPVMLTFDSFAVIENEKGSPISAVKISTGHDKAAQLMLTEDPGIRAYSALMPR